MLWQINVEQNGKFVDSGVRTSDPHAWITQHASDLKSYSAQKANDGLLADLKQGWASFKRGLKK